LSPNNTSFPKYKKMLSLFLEYCWQSISLTQKNFIHLRSSEFSHNLITCFHVIKNVETIFHSETWYLEKHIIHQDNWLFHPVNPPMNEKNLLYSTEQFLIKSSIGKIERWPYLLKLSIVFQHHSENIRSFLFNY
jgi:hypothetical protein